jgi:DNA processing protein
LLFYATILPLLPKTKVETSATPPMAKGDHMQIGHDHDQKLRGFGDVTFEERAARWALWRIDGLGFRRLARLADETGSELSVLFEMNQLELRQMLERADFTPKVIERVCASVGAQSPLACFERELDALPANTQIVHLGEPGYPPRLLDLEAPPVFLYVRGSTSWLPHLKTVAIVGSRKATVDGVRLARSIACELAQAGVVVVSGGALGVDAAAHRGCLDGGSPTIAVLAGGVERPTPRRNAKVFEATLEHGAIVGEYPLETRPRRFHFHRRNELIAALGDATLVVRASEQSGTMITARAARAIDRPLCALPGALDDPLSQGCHKLLVEGAKCVRGARDILEHVLSTPGAPGQLSLGAPETRARPSSTTAAGTPSAAGTAQPPESHSRVSRADLSEEGVQLLDALCELAGPTREGVPLDKLKRHLEWPASRLNPALLELELAGAVGKRAGANIFRPL